MTDRRKFLGTLGFGGMAACVLFGRSAAQPPPADEEEEEIDLKKVPSVVRKAADKAVPKAKWIMALRIKDEDGEIYMLEGTNSKGRDVTIEVTSEGEVEKIETEITLKEVPKVVLRALADQVPKFKATAVFSIREDDELSYQFEGKRPKDKEEITVVISADGKTVEVDED
jgi:hypothetical protein